MAQENNIGEAPDLYFSGDHLVLEVTVQDDAGSVLDLTGIQALVWELAKTVKSSTAHVTKSIGSGITVINATSGRVDVAIVPADTASLKGEKYHEMQMTDSNGNVSTVMYGKFTITQDKIQ